jgi:hypothetical protein
MFTKQKKTGHGYHVRPFETHKKVIDWEAVGGAAFLAVAVGGAAFLAVLALCVIGWLTT